MAALCSVENGAVLGSKLEQDFVDFFTVREILALCDADRCGVVRTAVLRQFPYPVFRNEHDILEGIVWNRILKYYGTRFLNESVKVAEYQPGAFPLLTAAGPIHLAQWCIMQNFPSPPSTYAQE